MGDASVSAGTSSSSVATKLLKLPTAPRSARSLCQCSKTRARTSWIDGRKLCSSTSCVTAPAIAAVGAEGHPLLREFALALFDRRSNGDQLAGSKVFAVRILGKLAARNRVDVDHVHGHGRPAEPPTGFDSPLARYEDAVRRDHHRLQKSNVGDAGCERGDISHVSPMPL